MVNSTSAWTMYLKLVLYCSFEFIDAHGAVVGGWCTFVFAGPRVCPILCPILCPIYIVSYIEEERLLLTPLLQRQAETKPGR